MSWASPTMTAANAPAPAVVSSKTQYSASYAGWKAFDGDTETWWNVVAGGPSAGDWAKMDLGVDGPYPIVTGCTIQTYSGTPNVGMNAFKVQGSNDDADWVDIYSGNCANNANVQPFSFPENTTAYRYLRIYCVSGYTANNLAIQEITLSGNFPSETVSIPAASLTLTPQSEIQLFPMFPPAAALILTAYAPSSGQIIQIGNALEMILTPQVPGAEMTANAPVLALILTAKGPAYVWAIPASARPAAQIIYTCTLTGDGESPVLPDLVLPMSSFLGRIRDGDPSYLSCIIPNAVDYEAGISARSNGDIVVKKGYRLLDGTVQMEEIARVDFETVRIDEGARSASATLVGHRTVASSVVKEITVQGVSYYGLQANTKRRIRAALDLFLRIGDTCIYGAGAADQMTVGYISYTVNPLQAIMEVTEA